MLDIGDPAIKLFGKTIPLLSSDEVSLDCNSASVTSELSATGQAEQKSTKESALEEDPIKDELEEDNHTASKKDTSSSEDQNSPNSTDENSGAESKGEKSLKKPDKILPCPRCNSMDTKFCYYNNYNVNQPRHFCKSCQRYWTAGGTMRNVPVGAGRRKNKSASSKYCHLSISDALRAAHFDLSNGLHHPHKQPDSVLKMNGTVLSFGADSPLCDSMESMMNLGDKKVLNGIRNTSLKGAVNPVHPIPNNMPFYPVVPLFPPPMAFYPAPHWNGPAAPWNMHWIPNPTSPTLGKHSREEDDTCTRPSGVLVPKTLRIDDPDEAAKSSIWTTLGIKKVEPVGNGGFFKGLQTKREDKNQKMKIPVLNTNPAALARSVSFQETS